MRTRFLLTLILIVLIGGTACNRSSKLAKQSIFMKRATGFAYEVLVVMDKDAWKGEAGRLLYDQLTAPIPGLPQNEPAMRVTYAEPFQFNGLLHYVRNIIHVRIDESLYSKEICRIFVRTHLFRSIQLRIETCPHFVIQTG